MMVSTVMSLSNLSKMLSLSQTLFCVILESRDRIKTVMSGMMWMKFVCILTEANLALSKQIRLLMQCEKVTWLDWIDHEWCQNLRIPEELCHTGLFAFVFATRSFCHFDCSYYKKLATSFKHLKRHWRHTVRDWNKTTVHQRKTKDPDPVCRWLWLP